MQTFDPLDLAEHFLTESRDDILLLLLGLFGALMIWVAFRKLRS